MVATATLPDDAPSSGPVFILLFSVMRRALNLLTSQPFSTKFFIMKKIFIIN
jgi:hypothetical protein